MEEVAEQQTRWPRTNNAYLCYEARHAAALGAMRPLNRGRRVHVHILLHGDQTRETVSQPGPPFLAVTPFNKVRSVSLDVGVAAGELARTCGLAGPDLA
jgi:hypothetical protein